MRIGRRKVANPLGLAVLALLREGPMHPYQMASTLRERHKEESIKLNYGSLYTVIAALERAGFVVALETVRHGMRPERTVYALTGPGETELRQWMSELLSVPVKEYPQFEAALSLMPVLPPDEAVELLEARANRLSREIAELNAAVRAASEQGLHRLFLVELEYHITMVTAERDWVMSLIKLIRRSPDFARLWRRWHRTHPGPATGARRTSRETKRANGNGPPHGLRAQHHRSFSTRRD